MEEDEEDEDELPVKAGAGAGIMGKKGQEALSVVSNADQKAL